MGISWMERRMEW